jgi:uncharacterized protein (DUF1330 family)
VSVGSYVAVTAYVISEVEILDETQGGRHRELAAVSIIRHAGHYLIRGAAPEALEGGWPTRQRFILVEFPSMEQPRGAGGRRSGTAGPWRVGGARG